MQTEEDVKAKKQLMLERFTAGFKIKAEEHEKNKALSEVEKQRLLIEEKEREHQANIERQKSQFEDLIKGLKDMKSDSNSLKLVPASLSGVIGGEKSFSPSRTDKICEETHHSDHENHSEHRHSFVKPEPPQDIQERIDLLDQAYRGDNQQKKGIKLLMGLTSSELYHKKSQSLSQGEGVLLQKAVVKNNSKKSFRIKENRTSIYYEPY